MTTVCVHDTRDFRAKKFPGSNNCFRAHTSSFFKFKRLPWQEENGVDKVVVQPYMLLIEASESFEKAELAAKKSSHRRVGTSCKQLQRRHHVRLQNPLVPGKTPTEVNQTNMKAQQNNTESHLAYLMSHGAFIMVPWCLGSFGCYVHLHNLRYKIRFFGEGTEPY
jgi:hypothetical protein